ncbi:MAG: hypothetical protein ACOC1F_10575 [Myxococcota bacterium]
MDDKVKEESGKEQAEEKEADEAKADERAAKSSKSKTKSSSPGSSSAKKRGRAVDDDDDDYEDDDDEDEDDEYEDEYDEDDDDEDDEDEDESRQSKRREEEERRKGEAKKTSKKGAAKKAKPVVKLPSQLPLPSRNSEILTGLGMAVGGYLAFWYGWMIYSESLAKQHVNYFSHSAWAFLVAFFLIVFAAFYFVRLERHDEEPSKGSPKPSKKDSAPRDRLDRLGVLLAGLICGPLYVIYWYKAYEIWHQSYATERPGMWVIYVALLAVMSLGAWHGLRPPSHEDEVQKRMPGRRVLMLLMTPFVLVYGMIYLASFYPPWPV